MNADLAGKIALYGSAASALVFMGGWLKSNLIDPVATKDFHNGDFVQLIEKIEVLSEKQDKTQLNSLAPRLKDALEAACDRENQNLDTTYVNFVIDGLMKDYKTLTGKEYPRGTCVAGVRVRT